ncbi:hypothetical protein GXY_05206 [Novacetimonas hansenii ATCC 23769]|uniref:Uncharacterized protein n=1 Tax=Novacetimonas hansenii ATCC 23769 TaxID=714995 RepID=D5QD35_NOVHA|nr:hypothetical protein GXY_05206 [Novacetimonas hansenii ATCC 23769]
MRAFPAVSYTLPSFQGCMCVPTTYARHALFVILNTMQKKSWLLTASGRLVRLT